MIRVLIVDDEAPARTKIARLVAADPRFAVVGEAADGDAAVAKIEELAPALVILDVQMPALTGFEVIDAIGVDACPQIIFSTAYDRYAIAAFDAAAVDYLLKPYDAARFQRALDRAHDRLGDRSALTALSGALRPIERVLVKQGGVLVPVPLATVLRLSAEDKHVRLHTRSGDHVVRQPLRVLESRLDPDRFVRIHRSEIVALDAVTKLEPWTHGDALLVLADGSTVVLSRTYRDAFLTRWQR